MAIMNRRGFIKTAALACPLIAVGGRMPAWARRKRRPDVYVVLKEKCDGCGDCVKICPVEAISMKDDVAVIDNEECIECDECVDECPTEAIVKKEAQPEAEGAAAVSAGVVGFWIFTGIFADGTASAPETVRFAGTATSGVLQSATGANQGTYKISGREVELRLVGDIIAKGRIVSADLMEGTMPEGKWKAERKTP